MAHDLKKSRTNMATGVYFIRNLIDGREYVGSTVISFCHRWAMHRRDLKNVRHANYRLQAAWMACGETAFEFGVIEECPPDRCIEREQYFIDLLDPAYNILRVAGSWLGRRHKPETIAKIRKAKTGVPSHPQSPETRAKIRVSQMGNNNPLGCRRSPETRAKISAARLGYHHTPLDCAKMKAVWAARRTQKK